MMSDHCKILIAPWGYYKNFGDAKYKFNGKETPAKSAFFPLFEQIRPNCAFILLPDTVIEKDVDIGGYDSIKDKIKLEVLKFFGSKTTDVKLIVLPGVGNYPNGNFSGKLTDYFFCAYSELVDYTLNALPEGFGEKKRKNDKARPILEFHLDLSHGINFMPAFVYRMVRELAAVFAKKFEVKFFTYNSEPFDKNNKKALTIHIVENTRIEPFIPRFDNYPGLEDPIYFLKAAKHGFPLLLFYSVRDEFFESINNTIKEELDIFTSSIKISKNSRWSITRESSLDEKVQILSLAKVLLNLFSTHLSNPQFHKCEGIRLRTIKNLVEKTSIFSEINKVLITRELDTICTKVGECLKSAGKQSENNEEVAVKTDIKKDEWIRYAEILDGSRRNDIDKRNFISHGGLERNTIEVIIHGDVGSVSNRICMRYYDLKQVKKIVMEI